MKLYYIQSLAKWSFSDKLVLFCICSYLFIIYLLIYIIYLCLNFEVHP